MGRDLQRASPPDPVPKVVFGAESGREAPIVTATDDADIGGWTYIPVLPGRDVAGLYGGKHRR
jgi:hypothetical protein